MLGSLRFERGLVTDGLVTNLVSDISFLKKTFPHTHSKLTQLASSVDHALSIVLCSVRGEAARGPRVDRESTNIQEGREGGGGGRAEHEQGETRQESTGAKGTIGYGIILATNSRDTVDVQ